MPTTCRVEVQPGRTTECELRVPVLAPSEYGGFACNLAAAGLDAVGEDVPEYRYWTDGGTGYALRVVGDEVRCVVRGDAGSVVTGRIEARGVPGTRVSPPIRVTIGAMVPWPPVWLP